MSSEDTPIVPGAQPPEEPATAKLPNEMTHPDSATPESATPDEAQQPPVVEPPKPASTWPEGGVWPPQPPTPSAQADQPAAQADQPADAPGDDTLAGEELIGGTAGDDTPGDEPPEEEKKKRRLGGILVILLSVLLIATGVWLGLASCFPESKIIPNPFPQPSGIPDMDGKIVVPDDPSATDPEFQRKSEMIVDIGGTGFQVPTVFLNVPIGSVKEVDGKMNPANFTSVFWIRNRGVSLDDAEKGTVYMVAHSAHGGRAPGNYVQADEKAIVFPGDVIKANQRTYSVVETRIIAFADLNKHPDLWTDEPGRLVFITCVQNTISGKKTDRNLVIIAKLVS